MSQFIPSSANNLKDKVVVLTGGSTGIGAATVRQLHTLGAFIFFGDVNTTAGEALASSLGSRATFVSCDTSSYPSIISLFRTAYQAHGRVDHAIACAGILERGKWFDPELTIESIGKAEDRPDQAVLDVNLVGAALFARVAVVFLRDRMENGENKSLVLVGSVASVRDSPGAFLYQTSKQGILGLMRAMRKTIHERDGIRVNCICPGMTESEMTTKVIGVFREKGLAHQTAEDVAKIIVGVEAVGEMNGKALYVESGQAWEFEDGLYQTMPQWLGEEATTMLRKNAEFVNSGGLQAAFK